VSGQTGNDSADGGTFGLCALYDVDTSRHVIEKYYRPSFEKKMESIYLPMGQDEIEVGE
jgi:hypothetical protein